MAAEKVMMKGNEALAEAALRAGCRFYSGYPITPQTEILEYLSWRMEESAVNLCRQNQNWQELICSTGQRQPGQSTYQLSWSGICAEAGGDLLSVRCDLPLS